MEMDLCEEKFGDEPDCEQCPYPKCDKQGGLLMGNCQDCMCPQECSGYVKEKGLEESNG